MDVIENINQNLDLIVNTAKNLNLSQAKINFAPPEIYKLYCTDKSQNFDFYKQNFNTYLLKQNGIVDENAIQNKTISDLFHSNKILNVFYFEVWGDVIEHKDPPGYHLGYESNEYKTVLIPIAVPSPDKNIFATFYDKKYVFVEEGKMMFWDVCNVPHYWKFNYEKIKKLFKLLHIDYLP